MMLLLVALWGSALLSLYSFFSLQMYLQLHQAYARLYAFKQRALQYQFLTSLRFKKPSCQFKTIPENGQLLSQPGWQVRACTYANNKLMIHYWLSVDSAQPCYSFQQRAAAVVTVIYQLSDAAFFSKAIITSQTFVRKNCEGKHEKQLPMFLLLQYQFT